MEPASDANPPQLRSAFDLLAEGLRLKLWQMRWPSLRPIQTHAIRAYLTGPEDLLIMAETAGGKTEAAFLPILSRIASDPSGSVRVIYVGPLKALINDQFERLESLCENIGVPVHRWHGDVSASRKKSLFDDPGGVLLITPESIESLLVNRTRLLPRMFARLEAVVIDELHAFLGNERGLHLSSLLSRLGEHLPTGSARPRLVALSATIGDAEAAKAVLSPDAPHTVRVISDPTESKEVKLKVHGYPSEREKSEDKVGEEPAEDLARSEDDDPEFVRMRRIATDLVEHCRTHANLVFANAKGDIEIYADLANEVCRSEGLPEVFLVHHGSLAREIREDTETAMKSRPGLTTICSSTLEMGVDIGSVRAVGQIGAPWSVASLKQRMGRSGRRDGEPRILRCYADSTVRSDESKPSMALPLDLLETVAVCDLMLEGWTEPTRPLRVDLSTLSHQVIATIAELGSVTAAVAHERLCVRGPFREISPAVFGGVLRALAANDIIEQGPDGRLILGLRGERLRSHRGFYAVFATPDQFQLVTARGPIGEMPFATAPPAGDHLVFAGRRWEVVEVDDTKRVILLRAASRRRKPTFTSALGDTHARIRERMLASLLEPTDRRYLDSASASALISAIELAAERGWRRRGFARISDSACFWLTWTGSKEQRWLAALLRSMGVIAEETRIGIECALGAEDAVSALRGVAASPPIELLAGHVVPKQARKYDEYLTDELLDVGIAADRLIEPAGWREWLQT